MNLNSAPSIIPSAANTRNLGTQTIPWAKIYVKEIWSDGVFKSLTDGSTLSLGGGSGGALGSRVTQQVVTGSVLNNQSIYADIAGFKGYMIYKITADAPCMVTIYSDDDARIADSGRSDITDPLPGSGVMAEIITNSNNQTIKFAPALFAYSDRAGTPFVPIRVLNRSGATRTFTIQVTMLQMES